jgi:hypothetical protein
MTVIDKISLIGDQDFPFAPTVLALTKPRGISEINGLAIGATAYRTGNVNL